MPVLPPISLLNTLVIRNATSTNATGSGLQVVCAWPVSGQYGPGSRILYYVLVAACVFARKAEWLRNACLAAALLFPAVAALHGIVLAALHVNNAVDMDVYGAFQLCSIGILAAPITVKLSRTYFFDPGRNTIFVWTGLILAGLLSLTVEFFRIQTSKCTHDDSGNPISSNVGEFPYGAMCGLNCVVGPPGPYSPMRQGSANNIYVIPAPDKLDFGAATLLAAACCIPAILSLIAMWNKILKINWKSRFGDKDESEQDTNDATVVQMREVNTWIRLWLSAVEIPLFGAAVIAILIFGERNFWSHQVNYQTEPIASIGQWAPIVGTGLAVLGSLYILLATDMEAVKKELNRNISRRQSAWSMREDGRDPFTAPFHPAAPPSATDRQSGSNDGEGTVDEVEIVRATSRIASGKDHQATQSRAVDAGNRRKVAKALTAVGNYLTTASHDRFDDSEFKHGKALNFPEIPGEENRNPGLPRIREQYNQYEEGDGNITPVLRKQSSRAGSFTGSATSRHSIEGSSTTPRAISPRRRHASTFPVERTSSELWNLSSSSPAGSNGRAMRQRSDTLEVPKPAHHSPTRKNPAAFPVTSSVTPSFNLNTPPSPSDSPSAPPTALSRRSS